MSRTHVESITGFLVVAISPALIIFLVAGLVFFLTDVFYGGDFPWRLRFACALFVIAAVLIARISIEEGREYASMFALPLSIVTVLSVLKYTDIHLLLILPLVGFIWWSTDKLTWDCTVFDDRKDASGEGLLQTVGLDKSADAEEELDRAATTDSASSEQKTLWNRWLEHRRRHHTPGVWVIYFGIAAIPMFGFGQMLLPEYSRGAGFILLCIYVASALALLMTTSFLQMRRYLMQRRLPFTDQMAAIWLGAGGIIIVGLMLLCLVLPRPNTGYSMLDSFEKVASRHKLNASRFGFGKEGVKDPDKSGQGEGQEPASESEDGQQASRNAKQGNNPGNKGSGQGGKQSKSGQSSGSNQDSGKSKQQGRNSKQPASDERQAPRERSNSNNTRDNADRSASQDGASDDDVSRSEWNNRTQRFESRSKPPAPSNPLQNFLPSSLPKWIYLVLIAIGAVCVFLRYGREIGAAMLALWQDILDLISRLVGGRTRAARDDEEDAAPSEPLAPVRPFSAYQDPFAAGTVSRFSPQQLVNYTFEALQAWANERNCGRTTEQTPLEFAAQISATNEQVGTLAQNLAIVYNQAAYAPGTLGADSISHARNLWGVLRGHARA